MNAWKPTDEQVEALCRTDFESDQSVLRWDKDCISKPEWREDMRFLIASPAFQSIIRAAQAEAWQQGYLGGHAVFCQAANVDTDGCPTNGEIDNPYEDQS